MRDCMGGYYKCYKGDTRSLDGGSLRGSWSSESGQIALLE